MATKEGTCSTHSLDGEIIETVYTGYIGVPMITQVYEELSRLLRANPGAHWLVETTRATGIAPAPPEFRNAVLDLFKDGAGGRIAIVAQSSAIRMLTTAFAFAFGMRLKSFEDRAAAVDYLRSGK